MKFIIFEYHLITKSDLSVRRNQASFFMKLLTLLSVLVRVYWLDNKSSPFCLIVMIRVYWLDDKRVPLGCHQV